MSYAFSMRGGTFSSYRRGLTSIILITVICIVAFPLPLNADVNEKKLIDKLLTTYDRRLRPIQNASHAINVTFGLALAQLIDVDEKNQIITTNCWLNQAWMDTGLTWNPKDFGGINTILLPYDSIWLPDVLLYNNADVASSKTSAVSTNVIVSHTGNITWLSTVIYKSSCTINVKFFPFDEQSCKLVFASWSYDGSMLNISLVNTDGDLSNYLPSSEFDLLKMEVQRHVVYYSCCEHPYPDITYYIHIRRRPMFYVFNMLLPCFLITLVALLGVFFTIQIALQGLTSGFYIPSDSGEKVTMGITTLLSMTVFLMLVTDAMPPTSDALPLIGIYYFITIGIVSLATAMTVCTLNIHHKGMRGKTVPKWCRILCFKILATILCVPIEYPDAGILRGEGRSLYTTVTDSHRKQVNSKGYVNKNNGHTNQEFQETLIPEKAELDRDKKISEGHQVDQLPNLPTSKTATKTSHLINGVPIGRGSNQLSEKQSRYLAVDERLSKVLQTISEAIKKNEIRLVEQDRKDAIKLQWQQVAVVVDRLLLFLFVTATVGITLGLMLQGVI